MASTDKGKPLTLGGKHLHYTTSGVVELLASQSEGPPLKVLPLGGAWLSAGLLA